MLSLQSPPEGISLNSNLQWEFLQRISHLCWCWVSEPTSLVVLTKHTSIPIPSSGIKISDADHCLANLICFFNTRMPQYPLQSYLVLQSIEEFTDETGSYISACKCFNRCLIVSVITNSGFLIHSLQFILNTVNGGHYLSLKTVAHCPHWTERFQTPQNRFFPLSACTTSFDLPNTRSFK